MFSAMLAFAAAAQGWVGAVETRQTAPNPPETTGIPKVVYGTDDRMDVYQDPRTDHRVWAASTCGLINVSRMVKNGDGSWTVMPVPYQRFGLPACSGEPFGDQSTAPFCSGFLVGADLVATAGHCINSSAAFNTMNFVFGFEMLDADTLRVNFPAECVYQATAIVSTGSGSLDHTILRLNRPVTAPGARPFRIRRVGVVEVGERMGLIGHPAGLPLKIAFGDATTVRTNTDPGFFVANTDSYAGNSGSPVINQVTGLIEGILVRGETDYLNMGACFLSNTIANNAGRGEDCTKITNFAGSIPVLPSSSATLTLSGDRYACNDLLRVTVKDSDLAGMGLVSVNIAASSGDQESTALSETAGRPGEFQGSMPILGGPPDSGDGTAEVAHGDLVTATYLDVANGSGQSVEISASALIDCMPPVISGVTVISTTSTTAVIRFDTDEVATASVAYGAVCGAPQGSVSDGPGTGHEITLTGLSSESTYLFSLSATDTAGNQGTDDNGGACHSFTTERVGGFYTEWFVANRPVDLAYRSLTFAPQGDPAQYTSCIDSIEHLPVDTAGARTLTLGDDAFAQVDLVDGRKVLLFGQQYDRVFVGSNGYLTFVSGDITSYPIAANHFSMPRVSGLFVDLAPQVRGAVLVQQLTDRFVATYSGIPVYVNSGVYLPQNSHTFQTELFFDGTVRISWQELDTHTGIVGLSPGAGVPANYASDDFSTLPSCAILDPNGGVPYSADINGDLAISLSELLRVVQLFNSDGYSCDAAGEDGYRPGPGTQTCIPHDTDYNPQNWRIDLSELLRAIQMFNAEGYVFDPHSEDGFRPKAAK
jgi:V8-like Glu-specific endopeptidase